MLKKDEKLYAKLAKMPPLNHKPIGDDTFDIARSELMKWLIAQPEIQEWLTREVRKSGALQFDSLQRVYFPRAACDLLPVRIGLGRNGHAKKTLQVEHVVEAVAGGLTKSSDIIAACRKAMRVSRSTVTRQLADAVWLGKLERTVPVGSYRLPKEIGIDSID